MLFTDKINIDLCDLVQTLKPGRFYSVDFSFSAVDKCWRTRSYACIVKLVKPIYCCLALSHRAQYEMIDSTSNPNAPQRGLIQQSIIVQRDLRK